MNRFQSIIDNIAAGTLDEARELYKSVSGGFWFVRKGKLLVRFPKSDEEFEFEFDAKDPDTQALLLLMNNLGPLLSAIGTKRTK